ncbi:hypothetical protein [Kineococcus radiotolerans]|uniref:Uncharacterized protein n=1 Tax=Kineococcus radiotolerans (strain ATCC BAA-149 / DSM 14245 / SRS30216) TaxID=266940 RepID=A6WH77_KINRD|nr:hypothetical protein [Kineococcus radiotolerans]ABS06166.1 hypothetical protein Krad_4708 [Kineococcus radiotolerans SRS30216 = ATCC BAA-149]
MQNKITTAQNADRNDQRLVATMTKLAPAIARQLTRKASQRTPDRVEVFVTLLCDRLRPGRENRLSVRDAWEASGLATR